MQRWLLRMSRWSRNPPSAQKVKWGLALIALCLLIYGIEQAGWWPDWATAQRLRR